MNAQGLVDNRRFRLFAISMGVLLVLILVTEIAVAALLPPTPFVSDITAVLCAAIAAFLYVRAWRRMARKEASWKVWGYVTLGIVLWAIAEALWAFYELVLKVETPYPSIADVFWLVGYIPIYAALLLRYRTFRSAPGGGSRWIVALFILLYSALLAVYVVKPILDAFDTSKLAESLTNMAYPVADWGLCILALIIIFSLERGRFAGVWRLFGAGILMVAAADALFFYATWNEIYYPDGRLNFISGLLDMLFDGSYLLLGLAIYAYMLLAQSIQSTGVSLTLKSLAKMNVLVFANLQGRVLSVSNNFMNLVHAADSKPYVGMDLTKALGLDLVQVAGLLEDTVSKQSLSNQSLMIFDAHGKPRNVELSSFAIRNEDGHLNSVALILRTERPPEGETEAPLQPDQQMLIDYYLNKAGTSQVDENQTLRAYFLEQLNLLYSIIQQFSGTKVADGLLERLAQTASRNHLQFSYSGRDLKIPDDLEGQTLRDMLLPLLQEARDFTADVTDHGMVEQELLSLDMNLAPETLRILDKYDFRGVWKAAYKPLPGSTAIA